MVVKMLILYSCLLDWFPGWPEFNHYNKQPNDDSLSGQDCVEIRRYFQAPGAPSSASVASAHPSLSNGRDTAHTFMWNDRDCNASNYFICERQMAPEAADAAASNEPASQQASSFPDWSHSTPGDLRLTIAADGSSPGNRQCNRTLTLTRDHPRAYVSSPGYPDEYSDNNNCFTFVWAPDGYRIVLEFEDFVLESEPECSYDFLEIIDPNGNWQQRIIGALNRDPLRSRPSPTGAPKSNEVYPPSGADYGDSNLSSAHTLRSLYMKYLTHQQRQQRSPNKATTRLSSYDSSGGISMRNPEFDHFVETYSALQQSPAGLSMVLRIPTHDVINAAADFNAAKERPYRVCGDWNARLKLLRYISAGPQLGMRFSSDYSHRRTGFKARVMLKNGKCRITGKAHAGKCEHFSIVIFYY